MTYKAKIILSLLHLLYRNLRNKGQWNSYRTISMLVPKQGTTMKNIDDLFFICLLYLAFVYNITEFRSCRP